MKKARSAIYWQKPFLFLLLSMAIVTLIAVAAILLFSPKEVEFGGKMIEVADPATFEQAGKFYAKDKKQVYTISFLTGTRPVKGADPASFETIGDFYARDKTTVYWFEPLHGFAPLNGVDPVTFQIIGGDKDQGFYARDNTFVYWNGSRLSDADPATFEYVGGPYAKDKTHVYKFWKIIPADPEQCTKTNLAGCAAEE